MERHNSLGCGQVDYGLKVKFIVAQLVKLGFERLIMRYCQIETQQNPD